MVKITEDWISEKDRFHQVNITTPEFDLKKMRKAAKEAPVWLHFGGGNLYRCFHAEVAQDLLNQGLLEAGIIVADLFGKKLIEQFEKYDNRTLSVTMCADGSIKKELLASTAEAHYFSSENPQSLERVVEVFSKKSLQLVTLTITEKGYIVRNIEGGLTKAAQNDVEVGPDFSRLMTTMGKVLCLLYQRWCTGQFPLALVSTDNFSHNGQRFKESMLTIASGWELNHHVPSEFLSYLENEEKISFPFTMIDRITPLPSPDIAKRLEAEGIEEMVISEGTSLAPFVNTEETHYLVIEDAFPNGRPDLSKAGVYLTDRDTVNKADKMKVCSLLNPLHTALAIFGSLLGYEYIWQEMEDSDLSQLVKEIGYNEGLPVVANPGIIQPKAFLDSVIQQRLPNAAIPDTPQRIATDSSQKLSIRYGETIKSYRDSGVLDVNHLNFIPLTIAAWCRYLLAVDDFGEKMTVSPDPLLEELQNYLADVGLGYSADVSDVLSPILSNEQIFGFNLYETPVGRKVETYFSELIKEKGVVRKVLSAELKQKGKNENN
ncbi:MAG: mannitol dehydrogenase family protein [Streptococcaceae bacterium]|jgi:fructuronate reductase|nr:mannitol dehydrogenase family protein [Streptococcaceae bacterium]